MTTALPAFLVCDVVGDSILITRTRDGSRLREPIWRSTGPPSTTSAHSRLIGRFWETRTRSITT
jgi:hypothetical protein